MKLSAVSAAQVGLRVLPERTGSVDGSIAGVWSPRWVGTKSDPPAASNLASSPRLRCANAVLIRDAERRTGPLARLQQQSLYAYFHMATDNRDLHLDEAR